jgi:hypothetical protein
MQSFHAERVKDTRKRPRMLVEKPERQKIFMGPMTWKKKAMKEANEFGGKLLRRRHQRRQDT